MSESFITEVRLDDQLLKVSEANPLLDDVREQHKKVLEVVDVLGKKIDLMKEKQRQEYMQAYEVHMQDVQKELHNMRELVGQIADERTKRAKIQQLKKDQIFYRQEAVRLDNSMIEYRKRIRDLTSTLNSVERERDWLLGKLRKTKKYLNKLNRKWSKMNSDDKDDGSESVFTADSELSIELGLKQPLKNASSTTALGQVRQMQSPFIQSSPLLETFYPTEEDDIDALKYEQEKMVDGSMYADEDEQYFQEASTRNFSVDLIMKKEKKAVADLVKRRLRLEGMVMLLNEGLESTQSGLWEKFTASSRSLADVLVECRELITQLKEGKETTRLSVLVRELVAFPDVYHVLLMLIGNKEELSFLETRSPWQIAHDGHNTIAHDADQGVHQQVHQILSHTFG